MTSQPSDPRPDPFDTDGGGLAAAQAASEQVRLMHRIGFTQPIQLLRFVPHKLVESGSASSLSGCLLYL